MQDFAYVARDTGGQKITGTLSAASERDALNMLAGKSLFPIHVTVQKQKLRLRSGRVKGQVMAIGGVKQKVLAAHRMGITEVVLPMRNGPDLDDVPENVRNEMTFHLAATYDDVAAVAFD